MALIIDVPSGWMYGFPKPIPENRLNEISVWLVENGYPQEALDKLGDEFTCRLLYGDDEKEIMDKLPTNEEWDKYSKNCEQNIEISDAEIKRKIENEIKKRNETTQNDAGFRDGWFLGIEWYREQLKSNKN